MVRVHLTGIHAEQERDLLDHDIVDQVDVLASPGGGLDRASVDDDPCREVAVGGPEPRQRHGLLPPRRIRRRHVLHGELHRRPPTSEDVTKSLGRVGDQIVECLGAGHHGGHRGLGQRPAQAPATTIPMTTHLSDRRATATACLRGSGATWPSLHG